MRRRAGFVLLTLGFFLVTLAPMIRFYVAGQQVKAPLNEQTKTTYTASDSSYTDLASGAQVFDAALVQTFTVKGDVKSGSDNTAVWNSFSALEDRGTGEALQVNSWRMAFDRKSGRLTNCCQRSIVNRLGTDTTTKQTGLAVTWPVADVHRKTYQQFDPITKRAWPAAYAGTEKIGGVSAYKFVQRIAPTRVDSLTAAPLQGLDGVKTYPADILYSAVVTTWVDPRTGMPIDQRRQVTSRVGAAGPVVLSADLRVDDTSRKALIKLADHRARQITEVRVTWPLIALLGGIVALGAGTLLSLRGGSGAHSPAGRRQAEEQEQQAEPTS
jgi:hypothetical protein